MRSKRQRQAGPIDLIEEIPALDSVEVRDRLIRTLEMTVGVLSEARDHLGTLPAEDLVRCLRVVADEVLPQTRQVLSGCVEELEDALPKRTGVSQTAQDRNYTDPEMLHKFGEQHRLRICSTACPDLDDAFFERLEKAGQVAFCPFSRG